jgi:hypothetical protein
MASKQHIKEAINTLCKIILHNGGTKITPEQFRLAKFDKNEVTGVMWKLLFVTVWFLKFNSFQSTVDFDSNQNQDIILWTKQELYKMGYYSRSFYNLPEDMTTGSRDILLAFGWLMSKSRLLDHLLNNCNNVFQECLPINWESLNGSFSSNSKKPRKVSMNFLDRTEESINTDQLAWVVGHLTLTCKGLFTAENQLVSLVGKIHTATQGVSTRKGHLSALEVFLLRHPKQLAKFTETTQQYNVYLENLLQFVEMQDVFWKWLGSVHESKISECDGVETWNSDESCKMCSENMEKTLLDICNLQAQIQKVLNETENQFTHASSDDLQSIWQVKLQEVNCKLRSLTFNKKPQSKQAVVRTFPELKHVDVASGGQSKPSSAEQEIDALKAKLSDLELNLTELRNEHFDIMNNVVETLEESVLIPPIGNSKYKELRNK